MFNQKRNIAHYRLLLPYTHVHLNILTLIGKRASKLNIARTENVHIYSTELATIRKLCTHVCMCLKLLRLIYEQI